MSEGVLKGFLEIPQAVEIINNCGLSSKTDSKKILKMARRNDISSDVANKIPVREDERKQSYQISKYTILKNNAYYVHHNWNKN